MWDNIIIKGAKSHNLKNINIQIPKNKFVVITGLSGSGKSSLAFDTLYAEGRRRYIQSLSSYARQFLGQMDKPKVDSIEGLSPSIAISQNKSLNNPRSTIGTVTEISDYLRLLWSRVGVPICPNDGNKIEKQSVDQIVNRIMLLDNMTKIQILAPMFIKNLKYDDVINHIRKQGFIHVMIDNETYDIDNDVVDLDWNLSHSFSIIVDRLIIKPNIEHRLFDSISTALKISHGYINVDIIDKSLLRFSEKLSCPYCGFSLPEIETNLFSFNNPKGACNECNGLGDKVGVDISRLIPDSNKSINDGAIVPWSLEHSKYYFSILKQFCTFKNINMNKPFNELTLNQRQIILNGFQNKKYLFNLQSDFNGGIHNVEMKYEGVIPNIERRFNDMKNKYNHINLKKYMSTQVCSSCNGYRLNQYALSVKINDKNIGEVTSMTIDDILDFLNNISFDGKNKLVSEPILKELTDRLIFLKNIGLGYLTLDRSVQSISGGESQRIRLATQMGSNLSGILYVLDEPSIGLHPHDNDKLISSLKYMRDLGNTLVVVEHDRNTILNADYLIDMGPGAGNYGGYVVAFGKLDDVMNNPDSLTGKYLSGIKKIQCSNKRRIGNGKVLSLYGANENNLKHINVHFPLGKFIVVTGVSGSGKSTLVNQTLGRILSQKLNYSEIQSGSYDKIEGIHYINRVVNISQSPIGKTSRSNPATYTGVFDDIRFLFAQTNGAKIRGYDQGYFSFNKKGGRCEKCRGNGVIKIEMNFLPDVYVQCDVCHGERFNSEVISIEYRNKNIFDILNMTVDEALDFFQNIPKIKSKLQIMSDVGLGYIKLGQPGNTLSGGESQRLKLASELQKKGNGGTFYILDEPTTGLHFEDINRLLDILQRLVDRNNTVLVVEHNLDIIKNADYLIDLGPEGGEKGGEVVATGTPEEVSNNMNSYTGQYLKKILIEN